MISLSFFKKIILENVGPISNLEIEFPQSNGQPKPLLIVGENGSGKSILLSYLVNALMFGKQQYYDDTETEKGRLFKYTTAAYIKHDAHYYFSALEFSSGEIVQEWQLLIEKSKFQETYKYVPERSEWSQVLDDETDRFYSNFNNPEGRSKSIFRDQCCLYFPVNRFEEPAWLNLTNLKYEANYTELDFTVGQSNRDIICMSPLKKI